MGTFFNPASLPVLQEKMAKGHPFIAEERENQIVWLSDHRGSFELETVVTNDDDWHAIQFEHEGKCYEADANVSIKDNGKISITIHAVSRGGNGLFQPIGTDFITVEVKKD
jgi:hypothetical protein